MRFKSLIWAAALSIGLAACQQPAADNQAGDQATTTQQSDADAEQGPEYTSAYICPMHCEGSGSDAPGKCPTCGMDYIANADTHEGHDHDDHEGHEH